MVVSSSALESMISAARRFKSSFEGMGQSPIDSLSVCVTGRA
jgi:hypothetical protein